MSFKIHLIIVSVIIVVIFVIMQFVTGKKEVAPVAVVQTSPYTITIERASWGLNCRPNRTTDKSDNYMVSSNDEKLKENNVLSAVSRLCNVKPRCDVAIDIPTLGEDPMPTCGYKILQIDYRCFAVDRMRTAKESEGVINIDCDRQLTSQ